MATKETMLEAERPICSENPHFKNTSIFLYGLFLSLPPNMRRIQRSKISKQQTSKSELQQTHNDHCTFKTRNYTYVGIPVISLIAPERSCRPKYCMAKPEARPDPNPITIPFFTNESTF